MMAAKAYYIHVSWNEIFSMLCYASSHVLPALELRRDRGHLLPILLIILPSCYNARKAILILRSDLQEDL